jgi:peptidyl-prolyl cis-trans isomerase D
MTSFFKTIANKLSKYKTPKPSSYGSISKDLSGNRPQEGKAKSCKMTAIISKIFTRKVFFVVFSVLIIASFLLVGFGEQLVSKYQPWVVKVDGTKTSREKFEEELNRRKTVILSQYATNPQAQAFVNSPAFQGQILQQIINNSLIEKIVSALNIKFSNDFLIEKVISVQFSKEEGGFDKEKFSNFLKFNNLNEKQYLKILNTEIVASLAMQSMIFAIPATSEMAKSRLQFSQEKRIADLLSLDKSNVKVATNFTSQELEKFYKENQESFTVPEKTIVKYLKFTAKDLVSNIKAEESEIEEEYKGNANQYQSPEFRTMYHLLFDTKENAEKFTNLFKKDQGKESASDKFIKIARQEKINTNEDIVLQDARKSDMYKEIADKAFSLKENQISEIIKTSMGYHLVAVAKIKPTAVIPLTAVRLEIANKIIGKKTEEILNKKIAEIEDLSLTKNLAQIKEAIAIKSIVAEASFDNLSKVKEVKDSKVIEEQIVADLKTMKAGQISKVYQIEEKSPNGDKADLANQSNKTLYLMQVEAINPPKVKSLEEVKKEIVAELTQQKIQEELALLANKLANEAQELLKQGNKKPLDAIAKKYRLKLALNQEISRVDHVTIQNRQLDIESPIAKALFSTKVGNITEAVQNTDGRFVIAFNKEKKPYIASEKEVADYQQESQEKQIESLNISLQKYLMKKFKVEVNENFRKAT